MHIMSDKTLGIVLDSLFRPNKCHKLLSKCLIGCLNNHSLLTLSLFQRTNSTVHSTFKYYTLQRKKTKKPKNYKIAYSGKEKKIVWKLVSSFCCQLILNSEVKFHLFCLTYEISFTE